MKIGKSWIKQLTIALLLCGLTTPVAKASEGTRNSDKNVYEAEGGLIQGDPSKKQITLVFTAGDMADGAETILSTLKQKGIKGAFFFTGPFFELFPDVVRRIIADGHYLGSHSYGHLLYASWEKRDSLLVTRQEFVDDMEQSFKILAQFGVSKKDAPYFIPPYEYYNAAIATWAREIGLQVINLTPGTMTSQDWTTPDMGKQYHSNERLWNDLMTCEEKHTLNGHLLLIHFGTSPDRKEKFYTRLPHIIDTLHHRGYTFVPLKQLIGTEN